MGRDSWKFGYLVREAVKSALSPRSRTYPLVIFAVLVGIAVVLFTRAEYLALSRTVDGLNSQGRNVVIFGPLASEEPVSITRESCESLARYPGVERAGIRIPSERLTIEPIGSNLATYRASATLIADLSKAPVVIGNAVSPGSVGRVSNVRVDGVVAEAISAPQQPQGLDANSSVIFGLLPEDRAAESCYAILDSWTPVSPMVPLLSSHLDSSGGVLVGIPALRVPDDPIEAYGARLTQFVPVAAALLAVAITGIVQLLRSGEFAAYRLTGTSRRSLSVLITVEGLLISSVASIAGTATALVFQDDFADPSIPILGCLLLSGIWSIGGALIGVAISLRSPISLARDH